jgi:hypothetical protein
MEMVVEGPAPPEITSDNESELSELGSSIPSDFDPDSS